MKKETSRFSGKAIILRLVFCKLECGVVHRVECKQLAWTKTRQLTTKEM